MKIEYVIQGRNVDECTNHKDRAYSILVIMAWFWIVIGSVGIIWWFLFYICQPITGSIENRFQYVFYNGFFTALSFITSLGLATWGLKRYFDQEAKEDRQSTSRYLSDMNIAYIQNRDFTDIYQNLDIVYRRSQGYSHLVNDQQYVKALKYLMRTTADKFSVISNYLSFFEVFTVLLRNGSVQFEDMNDLFYYRFSLAAQCEIIRNKTIEGPRKDFFRNVKELQEEWTKWRIEKNKSVMEKFSYKEFPIREIEKIFPNDSEGMAMMFGFAECVDGRRGNSTKGKIKKRGNRGGKRTHKR